MPLGVSPFFIGLIVAPLGKRLLKPLMRGVVKASVGIAMEVKKAAHETGENIHDLAAEVAADVVAAQIAAGVSETPSRDDRDAAGNGAKDGVADRAEGDVRIPKVRATPGASAGRAR